ncbi:hypothetical protein AKJ09_04089 [Labilithrix luteola]|uniref:DUF1963 domain-containing protein n=1 Tax=Labilithrix luteola TaxID=1391654 RepID=A0A0K1PV65_9BACT|nr:hypothetical protein [Labilithrix luteola]AKU97425.1 hypothetical protein AKJ09_04089 [Labilithrix luteola]
MATTKSFDERLDKVRYNEPSLATAQFSRDEVVAYIEAKAQEKTDFGYPYRDVLKLFPRDWWLPSIEAILKARWNADGARCFVDALFQAEPSYFADAPHELLDWNVGFARTMRMLQARPDVAREGLRRMFETRDGSDRWRAAAHLALLDASEEPSLGRALAAVTVPDSSDDAAKRSMSIAQWGLREYGYELRGDTLHRAWPRAAFHLAFPPGYLGGRPKEALEFPPGEALPSTFAFGGAIEGRNAEGGRVRLEHILTLDPVPPGLGVSASRLVLAASLWILEDERTESFYRHHPDGTIETESDEVRPHPAFQSTQVRLVRSPATKRFQSWGEGTDENLYRLGGYPVFVQSPSYPNCIGCGLRMSHLLSLDSGLPLEEPRHGTTEHAWGSGGVANGFWCDDCRISAWSWDCT